MIPPTACSVTPSDARKVVAPVDGCSEAIEIKKGYYTCYDPGPVSGKLRFKRWYGGTEPVTWDSNPLGSGDHQCIGTSLVSEGVVAETPETVHVWQEPLQ